MEYNPEWLWRAWYTCKECQKEFDKMNMEPNKWRVCPQCITLNQPYSEVSVQNQIIANVFILLFRNDLH